MSKKKGGFSHESYHNETEDWITPRYIIDAFGVGWFDLDPCASVSQPWSCARKAFTVEQDGLAYKWWDNVWLNPPYHPKKTTTWIRRLIQHGEGVALIFARTDSALWQNDIFPSADGYLFIAGRVNFYKPDGTLPPNNSGSPSCLIAWGERNRDKLIEICNNESINGAFQGRASCTPSNTACSGLAVRSRQIELIEPRSFSVIEAESQPSANR